MNTRQQFDSALKTEAHSFFMWRKREICATLGFFSQSVPYRGLRVA